MMKLRPYRSFMRINVIVACMLYSVQATTQYKYDHTWLTGIEQSDLYGQSRLEFKTDTLKINLEFLPFAFSEMNSCISDEDGNLLLYFNGCDIANGNHEILENGSGFNEGITGNWECPKNYGYPGPFQSALILPKPDSENLYFIFYMRYDHTPSAVETSLLYAKIDIAHDNGKGIVLYKDIQVS